MDKQIWFDLDGTIADLYAVEGWLSMLKTHNPAPYIQAKPMLNMSTLARLLHKAQRLGYTVGIISWLSKNSTQDYDTEVNQAKREWLKNHLPSVKFDEIKIVAYGTPKHQLCQGILFDDEEPNRTKWGEGAYEPKDILEVLRNL